MRERITRSVIMEKNMRILFISDRGDGGIKRHVQCLRSCLPQEVEHYTIGEDEPFAGKSGHDVKEFAQICCVIRKFKPDIVHFHTPNFLMALGARVLGCKLVCSWHTPTNRKMGLGARAFFWLLGKDCYFLPVSSATWEGLKKWLPYAKGEVFYNPMRVDSRNGSRTGKKRVIGMVGRNADQKDWPSFHKVADRVGVEAWNLGEKEFCSNAREKIGQMTVFVMTSKHEQLPTTMLECFLMKTAICGFIPEGGTSDVLQYSNGALKEVFIKERSCEKLAAIVKRLLTDEELRNRVVEDGWQILTNHFDAEKNCRGQLMEIYRRNNKW